MKNTGNRRKADAQKLADCLANKRPSTEVVVHRETIQQVTDENVLEFMSVASQAIADLSVEVVNDKREIQDIRHTISQELREAARKIREI